MIVLIDTCIFDRDRAMQGGDFDRLGSGVRSLGIRLVIPDVVRLELEKHVRKQVGEAFDNATKLSAEIAKLTDMTVMSDAQNREAVILAAISVLNRRFAALGASFHGTPAVTVDELIARDLAEQKPFNNAGKGLRDTVIVRSLIEVARESSEPIVLISSNSKDFADGVDPNQFHTQILEEIAREVPNPERVTLVSSLAKFNDRHVLPMLTHAQSVQTELSASGSWKSFNLREAVVAGISEKMIRPLEDLKQHEATKELAQRLEFRLDSVNHIVIESVLEASPTEFLVIATADVGLELLSGELLEGPPPIDDLSKHLATQKLLPGWRSFIREVPEGFMRMHGSVVKNAVRCLIAIDSSSGEVRSVDIELTRLSGGASTTTATP